MKIRESEIFNNYIKLALDAGLVSEDDLYKTADMKDKTRYSINDLTDTDVLYGHKLGPNNDKSIVEVAHPDTAVIVPAYDAMNSIVENLHQRQDIMTYVALKTPDGNLVQNRYVKAMEELKQSLIRTGFAMDSANEMELMKAADNSASTINSLEKQAFWGTLALNLAFNALPFVTDFLSGMFAKHQAKGTKDPKAVAMKLKPQIRAKAGKAFGRLGIGIALVTIYNTIKNNFIGSVDIGINESSNRLIKNLAQLISESDFDSIVNNYIQDVKTIQAANQKFTAFSNTIGDIQDVNELAGVSREESKPINNFFNAIDLFNQKSNNFKLFLDKAPINNNDSITGTEAEMFFRKMYNGVTGSDLKTEIANNIDSLVGELDHYKEAISVQIQQSVAGARNAIEAASEKATEEVVEKDYVQELMEADPNAE